MSDEVQRRRSILLLILAVWAAWLIHPAFLLVGIWVIGLNYAERRGLLDRWNATRVLGGILMIRTRRGLGILERISQPRLAWRIFGSISLVTCGAAMVVIVLLLAMAIISTIVMGPQSEPLPVSQMLLIPGVNPVIPLWWPLLAIILTLVIHEYGHAIVARAHGMRVRAFGLLMLGPLPLGAFAEPQGSEVLSAPRVERMRMFAAGPAVNIFAAIIGWLLIGAFAAGFVASDPGVHATGVVADGPADAAGLAPYEIITAFNGTPVESADEISALIRAHGANDTIVLDVLSHPDADRAREARQVEVTLGDRYAYYQGQNVSDEVLEALEIEPGDAFLGISNFAGGTRGIDRLAGPLAWEDSKGILAGVLGVLLVPITIIATPISNEGQIMHPHELAMIEPVGALAVLGTTGALALLTGLFWFIWMNIGLGFANLIPIVPFDGGHLMRDWMMEQAEKLNRVFANAHPLRVESMVSRVSTLSSLFLVVALFLMMVLPRI